MRSCWQAVVFFALALVASGVPALAQEAKGWIGIDVQDVTKAEADKLGWDGPRGAKLRLVAPGSPAHRAGLKEGDIITAIDRATMDTGSEVEALVAGKAPGSELRLQILSDGRERRVAVTVAQQPSGRVTDAGPTPILMLDPGGHMALIKGVAFTPDGKQVVSAGDDRVIRVWDWQTGKTVRTMRGRVGPGAEGAIFAMALSPDGRWLASAGWMTDPATAVIPCCGDIRLYDFASGELAGLLKGHISSVFSLAFSADSKRLISGGAAAEKLAIIWDVEKRTSLHRLAGHNAQIYSVGFTRDGARAVTASFDGKLNLWSAKDGKLAAVLGGHSSGVRSLATSPVDGSLVSGDSTGEIRLWDADRGLFVRTLGNQGGSVAKLHFSPDGKHVLSTCGYSGCSNDQLVWELATGKRSVTYTKHDNNTLAAAISSDGQLVATGGGNNQEVHVWDLRTGETRKVLSGTGRPQWAVGFAADGRSIAWGTVWKQHEPARGYGSLQWSLRLPAQGQVLGQPESLDQAGAQGFERSRPVSGSYALSHRKGGDFGYDAILDIKRDGQTVASIQRGSTDGYQHRSYTFSPDGQTVISGGGNGRLTAYDLKGGKIGDYVGHDSDVWGIAASRDGRMLISGGDDQTVRLWNLKTRELVVTLFHGKDGEWVMWTPQGYYAGSPGADKIVGWQINKAPDKAADYVGADQLRDHLHRPDIVEHAIVLASAEQAVRQSQGTSFKLADLLARPVPKFRIVSPQVGAAQRGGRASIKLSIETTPNPVQMIRAQVNGRQVAQYTPEIDSGGFRAGDFLVSVPLAKGRNEVRITLTNAIGDTAETHTLIHDGEGALDQRGVLHILAIGVSDYKGMGDYCGKDGCDLKSPSADARKFAEAIEKRLGPGHRSVTPRVLVNGGKAEDEPTSGNIIDALEALRQANENDTVVLFIAGHGINDGHSYRFLPTNALNQGGVIRGSTVVPWQFLQETIETAKGRRLLFVDTCHSGNAYNQRLGNSAFHANIIAYTAARSDQLAIEDFSLGHGLFTYAVVEGLEGKGGLSAKGQLSTRDLYDYVVGRVGELAQRHNREQVPQYFRGRDAEDFVLARW